MTQGMIERRLTALEAPRNVRDAGQTIDRYQAARNQPPKDLVGYVANWLRKARENNRYGR
jgi:hypothetical protein